MMTWDEYLELFDPIIEGKIKTAPYDKEAFVEYTRLNKSRMKRWLKTGSVSEDAKRIIASVQSPQQWILITEAWCGDAAHSNPFIKKLSDLNQNIELKIILRDEEPKWIESYLTNGNKSIPKLIIRDHYDKDLFTWGPRPEECEKLVDRMKTDGIDPLEAKKITQQWYNDDKGNSAVREIVTLMSDYLGTRS